MRTEDTSKKFRRWPPRVKRRRSRDPLPPNPPEVAPTREAEAQTETEAGPHKRVRIRYRPRRLPSRNSDD